MRDTVRHCNHCSAKYYKLKFVVDVQIRGSIVVSISACHADDPGSIPGRGVLYFAEKKLCAKKRPLLGLNQRPCG